MVSLAQELLTRLVPLGQDEAVYIRNRLAAERPAWPKVGERVWFRREQWDVDEQLHPMTVVDVQAPDDTTSEWATNLWQHLRHHITGEPLWLDGDRPALVPLPDPLPWVHLMWPAELDIPKGHEHEWKYRVQMTFESRMRGSPGWLPWDYRETRRLYLPGETPRAPYTTYRVVDGRIEQQHSDGDGTWLPYP